MPEERPETCTICGRTLPNRFAVAGRCEEPGCKEAFCAFHWYNGNRRCLEHGWKPGENRQRNGGTHGGTTVSTVILEGENMSEGQEGNKGGAEDRDLCAQADKSLPADRKASILRQLGDFALSLGKGAGALARKLGGIRNTDEALQEIEAQIAENRKRREPVSKRYDELYKFIVAKKKVYQTAPPARKKMLEMELKSAIAEYQSLERQLTAYLNNETILTKVRGRMCELVAMNLKKISESQIDKLTDAIEDAADADENIDGAIGDMDKAGVRRERDDGSFEDALAAFGDDIPDVSEPQTEEPSAVSSAIPQKTDPLADF